MSPSLSARCTMAGLRWHPQHFLLENILGTRWGNMHPATVSNVYPGGGHYRIMWYVQMPMCNDPPQDVHRLLQVNTAVHHKYCWHIKDPDFMLFTQINVPLPVNMWWLKGKIMFPFYCCAEWILSCDFIFKTHKYRAVKYKVTFLTVDCYRLTGSVSINVKNSYFKLYFQLLFTLFTPSRKSKVKKIF